MSFLSYLWQNTLVGWEIGGGFFEKVEFVTIIISAGLLGKKWGWKKHWGGLEEFIMKWAFHICWMSFVISTVFYAPFLKLNESQKDKSDMDALKERITKQDVVVQIQNATIQSYQAENATLNRKLYDINESGDPSAMAVKKRALNLCNQLEAFYVTYRTNQLAIMEQTRQKNQIETLKLGWPPPTEAIKNAEWQKKRLDIFIAENQPLQTFEIKWASKFTTGFYGQTATIRDQLANLGLRDNELDSQLENRFFTSAYWSQDLTMIIERLANQIK